MGTPEAQDERDEVVRYGDSRRGIYQKLVIRDDRLVGAILLGDVRRAPYLMQAFERGSVLPEERSALLFELYGSGGRGPVEQMGDDAPVCHCNGVSKADIRECAEGGICSLQGVMKVTRAGTGCGSCKPLIRELLGRFSKPGATPGVTSPVIAEIAAMTPAAESTIPCEVVTA
jgi:nitrite reductase (NADH) large subunit